ncbi:MAG: calcineurin-like phosphoesterase C-terminal domain-containing protein [Pseudomonadota bacterium]
MKHSNYALIIAVLFIGACKTTVELDWNGEVDTAPYFAEIDVVKDGQTVQTDTISGKVFNDANRNGKPDPNEAGIANVAISNGLDVVRTNVSGEYTIEVRPDMSLFVVQPSGWQVPTDSNYTPQFAYQHKPEGSPKALRFGGLPPTGPIPNAVNFPLKPASRGDFTCVVLGDIQAYANQDISYFRDSTIDDLLDRDEQPDCLLPVGDVMGDDLGLIPRMANVLSALKAPQWWTHGNHDFDFDADFDKDSADSWRHLWGPAYYAFEQGNVLFIVLDNVIYPCGPEDATLEGREYCLDSEMKHYNARVTEDQLQFVEQLIESADKDKTIVFVHHIPFLSFVDQSRAAHQTDNVKDLYALVEGRNALSLSGHTHTIENLAPGDTFKGWQDVLQIDALPFRHIIAGAASGSWYQGDFDVHGTPMALQRLGGPKGWLHLEFDAKGDYVETYYGANHGRERVAWLSISTPDFRHWFEQLIDWRTTYEYAREEIPPLSINDLPDVKILTHNDLKQGSFLTANVWNGSSETDVSVVINNLPSAKMNRTQQARGEGAKIGADYADPFAAQRQLSVARTALQSRSGVDGNQGYQVFKGTKIGPAPPQPQSAVADRNMHLWKYKLPSDLPVGMHIATVTITDRHGRVYVDRLGFEVRDKRPNMRFRLDVWKSVDNGAPVNR